ncbi:DNA-binding domain-containing protein [Proteiniphilum acetatigenes]|uniref:DNA-binding domain-containing protein n=1 Tax=Proteiniphilum acetatigenes TaxID=294710 RepID=UPI00037AA59B|nr:DNA-binding domain-containing protein [Proteiniphilum acetatigenes]
MLVITSKSLNKDDLIKTAVARRTDLNAITLRACIDILKQIAVKEVCNGASVAFGLGYFVLKDTSQIHTRIDREKQYADTRTRERIVTFYRTRTDTVFLDGDTVVVPYYFPERREEERDISRQDMQWSLHIRDSIQKAVELKYKTQSQEKEKQKSEYSGTRVIYHLALLVTGMALLLLIILLLRRK